MKNKVIENLRQIVGEDWVVDELSKMQSYLYDETEPLLRPEASKDCVVVKPGSPGEISQILKYANEVLMPVAVRGGATGVCAGTIPIKPSIVLSLERLNSIVELDEKNLMITVESGVTLGSLLEFLSKNSKLFFPIHPGDEGAQIGGMVAANAGGSKAVRHGIMRNHVKALEVVLPTGEIVTLGGKLIKNNAGYDLLHMVIGSEGTLGIITKATLKLYPVNKYSGTLLVSFNNRREACDAVPEILQEGILPLAVEYMDRAAAVKTAKKLGTTWPAAEGSIDLMFVLDEHTEDELYSNSEKIVDICKKHNAVNSIIAETAKEQRNILEIRSAAYDSYKEVLADVLDTAVPPSSVPDFFDDIAALAKKYNNDIVSLGHIADGNIHNFIMGENGKIPSYYEELMVEIYKTAIKYGGTITAEHGTGKTKKKHLGIQFSEREIQIMEGIKKTFDPNGILSPGNIVD
ncbi:FAD-binding oxidoreductase [Clostridium sp. MT-14]|uniref:FAD-binding oxidoreductase n=1 Tax=Clostridium aromativorans TaxID=2836848 RepID=A0ABS8N9U9_9CLOT|nr:MULTISPECIES: FAD-binding oxidoreductase [Clostridium]KAA8671379.1 FAD-binding oxidoreductase [Clostridium sp. HV4-5-A1G]MCC9296601.1 FAD-binding oxidoreductase [Clostridium aromativorans]CAB1246883.1 Putative FAD-linked oxidoreductase [Clostridiaceae bacterium BL-3]